MRNLQNIIDKTKKCKNKRGKFDKETGMCVLPENEIETRDEAIENAIYRMCDYFVNFEEKYRDMKSCMGREGYELIEGLKDEPYQNRFFDVNAARTFMHETILATQKAVFINIVSRIMGGCMSESIGIMV